MKLTLKKIVFKSHIVALMGVKGTHSERIECFRSPCERTMVNKYFHYMILYDIAFRSPCERTIVDKYSYYMVFYDIAFKSGLP